MSHRLKTYVVLTCLSVIMSIFAVAHAATEPPPQDFAPLEQWRNAIIAGDAGALKALYSTNPAAQILTNDGEVNGDEDANFWLALKASSIKLEIVQVSTPRIDIHTVTFNAQIVSAQHNGETVTVSDAQAWQQQSGVWRLRAAQRTDFPHLKQPSDMKKDIYPADADARAELKAAEEQAAIRHKRVLLVFGANWCYDCHVLDLAFQRPDLAPLLTASYEVVHVDLGPDETKNPDLVAQYEIPLHKGIPALAIADSDGKLLVSQKNGEFENARGLTPQALIEFLTRWKPESH